MNVMDATASSLGVQTARGGDRGRLLQKDFLRLMVAQLRNQSPLQPMESGQFLAQIAQFGTVSGIQDLQQAFDEFARSVTGGQALRAASLVGRKVLVEASEVDRAADTALEGAVDVSGQAGRVEVEIQNAAGVVMRRLDLGQARGELMPVRWDGRSEDGTAAPAGRYRLVAHVRGPEGEAAAVPVLVRAQVEAVTLTQDSVPRLQLRGVGELALGTVRRIY